MRQVVRELEPARAAVERRDGRQLVDQSLVRPQSLSMLVTSFAVVALLLSVIGIYGVMGYYVQQHLKEISIRMALGGSRGDVARLVVGQGMTVVIGGVIAGTALAFAATRLMSSLLFGVGADRSARVHEACAALMVMVALLAVRRAGLARDAPAAGRGVEERIGTPTSREGSALGSGEPALLSRRALAGEFFPTATSESHRRIPRGARVCSAPPSAR